MATRRSSSLGSKAESNQPVRGKMLPRDRGREVTRVSFRESELWWVVDYDLPVHSARMRFYRAVRHWLQDRGGEGKGWSTASVVFTSDADFARMVYDTAVSLGRAHLYRAVRVR